jgi:hypothetical protein
MPVFNRGEKVQIIELERESDKIYLIMNMKKTSKGGILYLLKSLEEEPVMRLYYEDKRSLLERIH